MLASMSLGEKGSLASEDFLDGSIASGFDGCLGLPPLASLSS